MAFCFKRKESVSKGIRRLGCERIEEALACLKDCRRAESIHCVRKEIKKTRAILRLVRTGIPKSAYRCQSKLLRAAAEQLSALRDAYVTAASLKNLRRHFRRQLASDALRHPRTAMQKRLHQETKLFAKHKTARTVEGILRRVAKCMDGLTVATKGWKAICPGVKASYAESRRAYHTILKDSSPENFHEWRKRAKDLCYQMRILRPIWPEQMDAAANELKDLGECLGDYHDLVILSRSVLKKCSMDDNPVELETLGGLIEQRRRELQESALGIGERFYTEKPFPFCNRLAGYWHAWRDERKGTPRRVLSTS
jgi:CHAD domain-containing protein